VHVRGSRTADDGVQAHSHHSYGSSSKGIREFQTWGLERSPPTIAALQKPNISGRFSTVYTSQCKWHHRRPTQPTTHNLTPLRWTVLPLLVPEEHRSDRWGPVTPHCWRSDRWGPVTPHCWLSDRWGPVTPHCWQSDRWGLVTPHCWQSDRWGPVTPHCWLSDRWGPVTPHCWLSDRWGLVTPHCWLSDRWGPVTPHCWQSDRWGLVTPHCWRSDRWGLVTPHCWQSDRWGPVTPHCWQSDRWGPVTPHCWLGDGVTAGVPWLLTADLVECYRRPDVCREAVNQSGRFFFWGHGGKKCCGLARRLLLSYFIRE